MIAFRDASSRCDSYSVFIWAANFSRLQSRFFSWMAGEGGATLGSDAIWRLRPSGFCCFPAAVGSLLSVWLLCWESALSPQPLSFPLSRLFFEGVLPFTSLSWEILKRFVLSLLPLSVSYFILELLLDLFYPPPLHFPLQHEGCCCVNVFHTQ